MHGGRSMPEALLYVEGKADKAGRPGDKYTVRYMEAGPCRRPYGIQLGSPTMREAHYQGQSLGLLPCTQSSISSPYPNLTQHLTQCKTSPHAHGPIHHHPILTRPSPKLPQILTLPSHLHSSTMTPHLETSHHLPTPSLSKPSPPSSEK